MNCGPSQLLASRYGSLLIVVGSLAYHSTENVLFFFLAIFGLLQMLYSVQGIMISNIIFYLWPRQYSNFSFPFELKNKRALFDWQLRLLIGGILSVLIKCNSTSSNLIIDYYIKFFVGITRLTKNFRRTSYLRICSCSLVLNELVIIPSKATLLM